MNKVIGALKDKVSSSVESKLKAIEKDYRYQASIVRGMFDADYYSSMYGVDREKSLSDFIKKGYLKNRNPNEYFDSMWYQEKFNVDKTVINPFMHYCLYGYKEGKSPSENFDLDFYLEQYNDVRVDGGNPLHHYMLFGKKEGRLTSKQEKKAHELHLTLKNFENDNNSSSIDLSGYDLSVDDERFIDYLREGKRGCIDEVTVGDEIEYLTFDIWDTVLRRKVHPDEIKLSAARYLYVNYHWNLKPAYRDIAALFKLRKKAEDNSSLTEDFEYRYEDAVALWLYDAFETGSSKDLLIEVRNNLLSHELLCEKRCSQPDAGAREFLKRNKSKKMIFVSDFYMSSEFIFELLSLHDLNYSFIKGYSSCDQVKNKRSGLLFDHVVNELDADVKNILHLGDNLHADVNVPKKKGINTYHYTDEKENQLHKWFAEAFQAHLNNDNSIHIRRILSILEKKASVYSDTKNDKLKKIGLRFSVVAIGFVLDILEEAKKTGVDKVYFFTREGVFLKELYDMIALNDPYFTDYPESELLEVSRLATFGPSLDNVDSPSLMRLWNQYSVQSPSAFCKTLNIDSNEVRTLFEEKGFEYNKEVIYPWKNSEFVGILNSVEFKETAVSKINHQKDLLTNYLRGKGLDGTNKAAVIVDLGWRGTIQDNLSFLVEEHLHGCYLGLFRYLNNQPEGTTKNGWLFNHNSNGDDLSINEVGPLEMLFNSLGGSTVGYVEKENKVIAIKKEEAEEDAVFNDYTHFIQQGMKDAVVDVIDYISIHALTANDLVIAAKEIVQSAIQNPPSELAESFFALTHNETFGAGTYQKMEAAEEFQKILKDKSGSELHYEIYNYIDGVRWKEGFYNLKAIQNVLEDVDSDITHSPLEFFKATKMAGKFESKKIGIFCPPPIIGSGGHRTIFNLARKFAEAGCEVYCFLEGEGSGIDSVRHYLAGAPAVIHVGWPTHLDLDMAIATIAHSAEVVSKMKNAVHKAYLVQDYEAWFNPIGDAYTVAENSYTHGLLHFTVGKFLTHVLQNQYAAKAIPAGLGVDTQVYFDKKLEREDAICFLYQPEKFRRNPQLAINALRLVKQARPDIKIYVYGSDAPIHLDFEVENLGLVHDLNQLNELYNRCKVGLCISMTNPSRIPFELMAAGAVPVDVYRYNNLLDYPSETIRLAHQSADSIAEAIVELFQNESTLTERRSSCIEFAKTRTLDWEMDVFVNNSMLIMNDLKDSYASVKSEYHEVPYISLEDAKDEVMAFCNFNKNLSS